MKRLSVAEAGALLGQLVRAGGEPFDPRTVRNWCRSRRLPYLKIGRSVSFDAEELRSWAESQKRNRQPQPLKF